MLINIKHAELVKGNVLHDSYGRKWIVKMDRRGERVTSSRGDLWKKSKSRSTCEGGDEKGLSWTRTVNVLFFVLFRKQPAAGLTSFQLICSYYKKRVYMAISPRGKRPPHCCYPRRKYDFPSTCRYRHAIRTYKAGLNFCLLNPTISFDYFYCHAYHVNFLMVPSIKIAITPLYGKWYYISFYIMYVGCEINTSPVQFVCHR